MAAWFAAFGSHPARFRPATLIAHEWRVSTTNQYDLLASILVARKAVGPSHPEHPQCRLAPTMSESVSACLRPLPPSSHTGPRGRAAPSASDPVPPTSQTGWQGRATLSVGLQAAGQAGYSPLTWDSDKGLTGTRAARMDCGRAVQAS